MYIRRICGLEYKFGFITKCLLGAFPKIFFIHDARMALSSTIGFKFFRYVGKCEKKLLTLHANNSCLSSLGMMWRVKKSSLYQR